MSITVNQLIEKLQQIEDKSLPVMVWVNSQSPMEPLYMGASRIPIVQVDTDVSGLIDICCEGDHQEGLGESVFTQIKRKNMTLERTKEYILRKKRMIRDVSYSPIRLYEMAFCNQLLCSLNELEKQFEFMKKFGRVSEGPSVAQIIEYLLMDIENDNQEGESK